MERNDAYTDESALKKTIVIGSVISGVALFALSVAMMVMIGVFLGALVLTERIARECSEEEEQAAEPATDGPYLRQRYAVIPHESKPEEDEPAGEIGGYDVMAGGVVIAQPAFSRAA